jgi:hypothetical protein
VIHRTCSLVPTFETFLFFSDIELLELPLLFLVHQLRTGKGKTVTVSTDHNTTDVDDEILEMGKEMMDIKLDPGMAEHLRESGWIKWIPNRTTGSTDEVAKIWQIPRRYTRQRHSTGAGTTIAAEGEADENDLETQLQLTHSSGKVTGTKAVPQNVAIKIEPKTEEEENDARNSQIVANPGEYLHKIIDIQMVEAKWLPLAQAEPVAAILVDNLQKSALKLGKVKKLLDKLVTGSAKAPKTPDAVNALRLLITETEEAHKCNHKWAVTFQICDKKGAKRQKK